MKSKYIEQGELDFLRGYMSRKQFLPYEVSLQTGLRIGDVLKIKHGDVRGCYVYFVAQKTGKPGRAKITPALARALREPNGSEYCFAGRDRRKPLTRQTAWKRLKKACERAGIESAGISPHAMRKVFAVEICRTDGAEAARKALQHDDRSTTQIYVLADWLTGENAKKPLLRGDICEIVEEILRLLKISVDKL